MPGCGKICFFTETELSRPEQSVLRVLELCGVQSVGSAFRTFEADCGWEAFRESLGTPFTPVQVAEDDVPTEDFYEPMSLEEAAELFSPGGTTHLLFGRNHVGIELANAIRQFIPDSISATFVPNDPSLRIGWHDLFEMAEHEEGYFYGRAFFSLSLFGNGTPNDWEMYRRLVFDVPTIRKFKEELEAIVGPLKQCVYWDI